MKIIGFVILVGISLITHQYAQKKTFVRAYIKGCADVYFSLHSAFNIQDKVMISKFYDVCKDKANESLEGKK